MSDHESEQPEEHRHHREGDRLTTRLGLVGPIISIAVLVGAAFVAHYRIGEAETRLAALTTQFADHMRLSGAEIERLHVVEAQQVRFEETMRSLDALVRKMDTNIAVICRTTKGANCVP